MCRRSLVTDTAHANAQIANDIFWKLHAKRQQAFRFSNFKQGWAHPAGPWYEFYELKDTWKGSKWKITVKPHDCWPFPKNPKDCPYVKQKFDEYMGSILENWKHEVGWDQASVLLAQWTASH